MGKVRNNRKYGFKKGHQYHQPGTKKDVPSVDNAQKIERIHRIDEEEFHSFVGENLEMADADGAPCLDVRLLRPRKVRQPPSSKISKSLAKDQMDSYRILNPGKAQGLFNCAFKNHTEQSPDCSGDLIFDPEVEKRRGFGWQEGLKCTNCSYKTETIPMYESVKTGLRGPPNS